MFFLCPPIDRYGLVDHKQCDEYTDGLTIFLFGGSIEDGLKILESPVNNQYVVGLSASLSKGTYTVVTLALTSFRSGILPSIFFCFPVNIVENGAQQHFTLSIE